MARGTHPVHFANFICHFGDAELLDYLDGIVLPSFLGSYRRVFKDTKYFFHEVEAFDVSEDSAEFEPAICGRFVKDMIVRSEQRFDSSTGELERSVDRMETAPSAIFALLLRSHKLLYLHETSAAPGLESFRSTAESFLRQGRIAYIDRIYAAIRSSEAPDQRTAVELSRLVPREEGSVAHPPEEAATKAKLRELIGSPNLEVVPLANEDSLRDFVNRFKILQTATVRLLRRNSELDNDDFFESVRLKGGKAGAETSTIVYKNTDGLAKEGVVTQLESALTGNAEVKLEGKDELGQQLRGSNDEFKVVAQMEGRPTSIRNAAVRMLRMFRQQQKAGLVQTGDAPSDVNKEEGIRLSLQNFSELQREVGGGTNGRPEG